jgi:ribosomal protein L29
MKKNKKNSDFQQLSADALKVKVDSLRQELFSLKLNTSTAHVKDYSQFKKLRANIARALTYMQQKHSSN